MAEPTEGEGGYRWNAGGWFGSQLGATCWMLVAGILVGIKEPMTGVLVLALCAAANGVGFYLWSRRDRLSPYPAMQTLIGVVAVASLLAVFVLESRGRWEEIQSGGTISAPGMYLLIVGVFGGVMAMLHLQHGRKGPREPD